MKSSNSSQAHSSIDQKAKENCAKFVEIPPEAVFPHSSEGDGSNLAAP